MQTQLQNSVFTFVTEAQRSESGEVTFVMRDLAYSVTGIENI